MTFVYVVKSTVTEDVEGMELDPIRYMTLDKERAIQYVKDHSDDYLWVDGYELDGTNAIHVY